MTTEWYFFSRKFRLIKETVSCSQWMNFRTARFSPLGAWGLRSKSWCRPSDKFFSTPKFFASQTFAKLCNDKNTTSSLHWTCHWGLPKKKYQSLSQALYCFSEVKGSGSLESRWACSHISRCSRDFKMAATSRIIARSSVKSIFWSTGAIHFNLFTTRV